MHIEPDDDPDSKVVKLEELKELLKDEKDREQFDDLIEEAKAVKLLKEASEDIAKTIWLLLMTLRILKMVVIMKSSQTTIGQKNTRIMIPPKHWNCVSAVFIHSSLAIDFCQHSCNSTWKGIKSEYVCAKLAVYW